MKIFKGIAWVVRTLIARPSLIQLLALCAAGPVFTLMIHEWFVFAISHDWGKEHIATQLQIAREAIAYAHILLGIVLLAMTAGLVRGFKMQAFGASAEVDLDDDDKDEPAVMTTTTTTEVAVKNN